MVAGNVKHLRTHMTDAERKLWRALRSRSMGAKFRLQAPLGPFIVDFVCFDANVIVEADGGQHVENEGAVRDEYLSERGYRVLRFWNNDVLKNIEGVLTRIVDATNPLPGAPLRGAPPSPSSRGEGKKARARS